METLTPPQPSSRVAASSQAEAFEQLTDGLPLPPLQEGYVRLYRGDAVDEARLPLSEEAGSRHMSAHSAGRWFTDAPAAAEGYAVARKADSPGSLRRQRFIDLPVSVAETFNTPNLPPEEIWEANGGHSVSNEWLLPPEFAEKAREYQVQYDEKLYEPGVEDELTALFYSPDVTAYFYNIDPDSVPDLIKDPNTAKALLEQLSMGLGQGHLPAHVDQNSMGETIHRLHRAVESSHTKRLLGKQPAEVLESDPRGTLKQDSSDW